MIDKISAIRIKTLHPAVRNSAMRVLERADDALTGRAQLRISHALRTFEEQAALYAQGRTKPGSKVTNAPPGKSWHNYGLAFDIVLIIDGKTASWETLKDFDGDKVADWMEVVKIAKEEGWSWGGDFKSIIDKPHFEKSYGLTVTNAMHRYKTNDLLPGTTYIRL